jgi:hypothetical protein
MTNEDLLTVAGILLLLSAISIPPASGEVDYYEGFSAEGIHAVPPSPAELAMDVLYKFDSEQVMVYIGDYGVRYTVKTGSGNRWVQYQFRNPNAVLPVVNHSEKSVTWFNLYHDVDIKYYLENSGLKQEIVVHDTPPATKFYEKITVSPGVTYQRESGNEFWFYHSGTRLFRITKPFAVGANGTHHDIAISKVYASIDGTVEPFVCIDAAEIFESGDVAYPVTIDPTTDSGGVMFFWDEADIPTLNDTVSDASKLSYDVVNDTYTMHIPFYHNKSSSVFAFNETVHLKWLFAISCG